MSLTSAEGPFYGGVLGPSSGKGAAGPKPGGKSASFTEAASASDSVAYATWQLRRAVLALTTVGLLAPVVA